MKAHLWLIRLIGVIVPQRLRLDWRQEWEAELGFREAQLAEWDRLDWRNKLALWRRSLGAFRDALWMQTFRWEDDMIQDLRFGLRMLRKNLGVTLVAIFTLGLGIGANTAIFSVINAVLLRPLPYAQSERLALIWGNFLKLDIKDLRAKTAEYKEYLERTQSFDEVAAFYNEGLNLTRDGAPERIAGVRVTANLFTLLDARAAQGRVIADDENQSGRDAVVVISHGFWQEKFGGAENIIGQQIRLNNLPYTVIGVMPEGFQFPHKSFAFSEPAEVWLPAVFDPAEIEQRNSRYMLNVLARLKPQVSFAEAQAEMTALGRDFEREYRGYRGPNNADGGWRITVVPLREQIVGGGRRALWILFAVVGLVLLIACANVANLLLVRATHRQKEIAIRLALGARRTRIMRQLLIESLLLSGLGGALGLALAAWGVRTLALLSPANLARASEIDIDGRVLVFTLLVAFLSGLIFGLLPAWQASQPDMQQTLKESAGLPVVGKFRVRELLVVGQIALALVVLSGAGLLIHSFLRLQRVSPGVDKDQVLIAEINLPASKYPKAAEAGRFFEEVKRRIEALPGVEQASFGTLPILSGAATPDPVSIEGREMDFNNPPVAAWQRIAPDYFAALGIPFIAGRDFSASDNQQPVAIINESMARRYFPDGNALGQRITPGLPRPTNPFSSIIGIVKDIPHRTIESTPEPDYYLPFVREPRRDAYLFIRMKGAPLTLAPGVRAAVLEVDSEQPVTNFQTMREVIDETTAPRRFNTLLLGGFAVLALLLAVLGVYSVNAYAVTQRTPEIGIRLALGAGRWDIVALVMRRALIVAFAGMVLGLAGALVLSRLLRSLLFEISPTDPLTFIWVALLLIFAVLLACYLPARRATRLNPMIALRHQ
jgi:putative ABC transport system permease protein